MGTIQSAQGGENDVDIIRRPDPVKYSGKKSLYTATTEELTETSRKNYQKEWRLKRIRERSRRRKDVEGKSGYSVTFSPLLKVKEQSREQPTESTLYRQIASDSEDPFASSYRKSHSMPWLKRDGSSETVRARKTQFKSQRQPYMKSSPPVEVSPQKIDFRTAAPKGGGMVTIPKPIVDYDISFLMEMEPPYLPHTLAYMSQHTQARLHRYLPQWEYKEEADTNYHVYPHDSILNNRSPSDIIRQIHLGRVHHHDQQVNEHKKVSVYSDNYQAPDRRATDHAFANTISTIASILRLTDPEDKSNVWDALSEFDRLLSQIDTTHQAPAIDKQSNDVEKTHSTIERQLKDYASLLLEQMTQPSSEDKLTPQIAEKLREIAEKWPSSKTVSKDTQSGLLAELLECLQAKRREHRIFDEYNAAIDERQQEIDSSYGRADEASLSLQRLAAEDYLSPVSSPSRNDFL